MTAPLSPEERDALRRLAEKATPGPWRTDRNWSITAAGHDWSKVWLAEGVTLDNYERDKERIVCRVVGPGVGNNAVADHDFIAACSPDRILALLADHARLTVALQAATEDAERWKFVRQFYSVEHDDGEEYLFILDDSGTTFCAAHAKACGHTVDSLIDLCAHAARLPTEDTKR